VAHPVEVRASHVGMAVDPRVVEEVGAALSRHRELATRPRLAGSA
jgi:hypothetical protein